MDAVFFDLAMSSWRSSSLMGTMMRILIALITELMEPFDANTMG
jgi:hypothetical protein